MELNEDAEYSAMREALEEGGAIGSLGRYLGTFDNIERRHRTKVFVLYVNRLGKKFWAQNMKKNETYMLIFNFYTPKLWQIIIIFWSIK